MNIVYEEKKGLFPKFVNERILLDGYMSDLNNK